MDETLDFDHMVRVMTDPEENQLDFVVLDPDILDLSRVLYHYDEKLSLYKGDYGVTSVYPAPEILAIRLFLLKKINSREKFDLNEFMRREADLLNENYQTSQEDLAATRLTAREMKFLRDTFQNDPAFYRYLSCPFLLKEIAETEVLASGDLTGRIIESADYSPFQCKPMARRGNSETVRISFLPSMTKEFVFGNNQSSLSDYGFQSTEFLEHILIKLKKEILDTTRKTLKREISRPPYPEITESQWRELWHLISQKDIAFYAQDERPLVIYPENATKVISEVCPEADFTVILLGKNTYRTIYLDPAKDLYPSVNRLYMDIMDIQNNQVGEEIAIISQFICSHLKNRMALLKDAAMPPPPHGKERADIPRYSLFIDEARRLQKEGKPVEALKTMEAVYGSEVPVQTFYNTLDRFKTKVINHIDDELSIRTGQETYTINDLKAFFMQVLLTRPDTFHCTYLTQRELPLGRFLFLNLVYGNEHPIPTKDPLLKPAYPRLDLSKAIHSPDPWIVSAAIFMARKEGGGIPPEILIRRWQQRPDLWDDICTEQSMLYLAGFKKEVLKTIRVTHTDVREQLGKLLESPVPDEGQVQVLAFWMGELAPTDSRYLHALSCGGITVKEYVRAHGKPAHNRTVQRGSGDQDTQYEAVALKPGAIRCRNGILTLSDGAYSLKYAMDQAHGGSRTFHCRKGRMTRLVLMLFGHI